MSAYVSEQEQEQLSYVRMWAYVLAREETIAPPNARTNVLVRARVLRTLRNTPCGRARLYIAALDSDGHVQRRRFALTPSSCGEVRLRRLQGHLVSSPWDKEEYWDNTARIGVLDFLLG